MSGCVSFQRGSTTFHRLAGGLVRRLNHAVLPCFLLVLAAGCAGIPLPKTIADGDVTPKRKKRDDEITRQFDQQRDFAEYEAAKSRWEQQRDVTGCREGLEKLLARRPQHREARLLMAELLLNEDEPQAAYRHAKEALDVYPNDAQVQYTMALTLDAQGKTSDALGYYERATRMDPQSEAFAAAYRTAREAAHEELRRPKATMLGASNPKPRPAVAPRPDATAGRGFMSDVPDANESADNLTDEALPAGYSVPAAPLPPGIIALTLNERSDSHRSAKSADSAGAAEHAPTAEKPDNPQIAISAAAAALRANRPDRAVELLMPAAKQFPNSPEVHRMLGAAYYRTGDYKSSQVALQQALSLDKSSALSYLLMGCTLAKLGQNEAAEAHFRQARTLDPKYRVVR